MREEIAYYARMAKGVWELAREPRVTQPVDQIRHELDHRASNFLDTARHGIFAFPDHPSRLMCDLAGCAFGDLEDSVRRHGVEKTLEQLRAAGVYLSHDEFKGTTPIVRGGREIASNRYSFRNRLLRSHMRSVSSGSRSRGTQTPQNTPERMHRELLWSVLGDEFEIPGSACAQLTAVLPSVTGVAGCVRSARLGTPLERWFSFAGSIRDAGHYRAATRFMVQVMRCAGIQAPSPDYLPPNDFQPVVNWIVAQRAGGRRCTLRTSPSAAVRVAAAAAEAGHRLDGTTFLTLGEAVTDPKRAAVESVGGSVFPSYGSTELGLLGHACRPMRGNRVHFFSESSAVTQWRRQAPRTEVMVNSLLFTPLLSHALHHVLNMELDDAGTVEQASCDCHLTRAGFTTVLADISSFGKLNGQGSTLLGTDLANILEEGLPRALGGQPGDFQLVEYEGAHQTQLVLRVSPRVGLASTEVAREALLKEIRRVNGGAPSAVMWNHSEAITVEHAEPFVSRTGKVLSLCLLGDKLSNHAS